MNTPDTEWEEKVKAEWSEYDNGVFRSLHSTIDFISSLLTSRDTYWKERVEEALETEYRKRNPPNQHNILDDFRRDVLRAITTTS